MYSAVTKSEEKCCLNNPGVGSNFGSTKLASARRGGLTLAALSALLLIVPALARAQTETVLYSFCAQSGCRDGYHPRARLVLDTNGNLYGTTDQGGANGGSCSDPNGCGTVFEVSPSRTETVLYSFCPQSGCRDGYHPLAGLVLDTKGNLYGTAFDGGAHDGGAVFEISPNGTETVLYSFCVLSGCRDGYYPHADLVMDTNGNLYGTTQYRGAHGGGIVFKVSPNGTETVLYSFCAQSGCTDGYHPVAGLVMDTNGNLYGTTLNGGVAGGSCPDPNGCGTVFKLSPSGAETVLYSFCAKSGCTDGYHPVADLILDTNGNLYGTTRDGGANGKGTVFEVSPSGTETVLHSFCAQSGCRDGSHPLAGLVLDANGNLYGTTNYGGKGRGTVFEVSPSGTETVLHSFIANGTDGNYPAAGLVLDTNGNLYGTTLSGGAHGGGTVFQVVP